MYGIMQYIHLCFLPILCLPPSCTLCNDDDLCSFVFGNSRLKDLEPSKRVAPFVARGPLSICVLTRGRLRLYLSSFSIFHSPLSFSPVRYYATYYETDER